MARQGKVLRAACVVALALSACTQAADDDSSGGNNQNGTAGVGVNPMAAAGTSAAGVGVNPMAAAGTGAAGTAVPIAGMVAAGTGAAGVGAAGVGVAGMDAVAGAGGAGGDSADTGEYPDPRGTCPELDSGFMGDDTCIAPPDPSEGIQIRVGPQDYANPGRFLFGPGMESSECVSFRMPNTEDIYYQSFVVSARPGTHHIINTMYVSTVALGNGVFEACLDLGIGTTPTILENLPGASKPYMPRKRPAAENAGLGRPVPAGAPAQADMHYFNFTENTFLREFWMNLYFISADQVTEVPKQIRGMGTITWQIPPGDDKVWRYEAPPVTEAGRIVSLLGHYHAHGKRFTSHVRRASGERVKVFEMYDYNDPKEFQYDSGTQNPVFSDTAAGAYSGTLMLGVGDVLEWECHIVNDSPNTLTYSNAVETGEMCNIWGATVGPLINHVVLF